MGDGWGKYVCNFNDKGESNKQEFLLQRNSFEGKSSHN